MTGKNRIPLLLIIVLLFSCSFLSADEQPLRGKALFQKLQADRDLIKFEGLRNLTWTPDGKYYYTFEKNTYKKYSVLSKKRSDLFQDTKLIKAYNALTQDPVDKLPFKKFSFLDNGEKIRFTAGSRAFIYDLANVSIVAYTPLKQFRGVRGRMYGETLSPDLKHRAFTKDFDLYVADMEGNEKALTKNGHKDLRNGYPDWVYPEELSQYQAYWWSPDSTKIAYMQFDESPVTKYPIVHDIDPKPVLELQSYPKAGANNPIINFFIVDIRTKKTVRIKTGMETNVYLFRGEWTSDGTEFTYQKLNRLQNTLELYAANPETGETRLILKDKNPCYLEADFDLKFLKDNKHLLWTSERSGWKEIYLYDLSGTLVKQLTSAMLPVGSILGVDEKKGWVYFSGSKNRGLENHAYRVKLDGTGFSQLTKEPGMHSVRFSPDFSFFTDSFSSFDSPTRTTLHRADGGFVRELGNSVISQAFKDLKLVKPEHFTFKSADGKYDLDGMLYKPAHFDSNNVYPLILSVYGGPGAKRIYNRFSLNDRNQALAQLGFMVATVDHRGISRRGKAFQNLMYMNLGQIELADHVAAVKHLTKRSTVDEKRVGIYGHSYGGYLTCIALLKAPDVFHVGVAGAPVTDWRNYDTIYTERYMRRPQDNLDGYEKGSCMTYAKDLKGHLAIHHGAVDDNVHPGNSVQLIQELLKHGKRFDFMLYPGQKHGIRFKQYGEARVDYFIRYLNPEIR